MAKMDGSVNVLVVDDDPALRSVLVRALKEEGYAASSAASGAELLDRAGRSMPDVLILDLGLPDCDGRDLCSTIRTRDPDVPIMMLTARDALVDRLSGFDSGADDYLTKPFALEELLARLEAVLRRSSRLARSAVREGALVLDPSTFHVRRGDAGVRLTPTEYRLLARLMAGHGSIVTRSELKHAGWPRTAIVHENTLDTYIARLRRHLRELHAGAVITTVTNMGYRVG